jgi:hypothetical protein
VLLTCVSPVAQTMHRARRRSRPPPPPRRGAASSHCSPTLAADRVPTLVGDLQSELGCPGDWDPACAATTLEPVDGIHAVPRSPGCTHARVRIA